MRAATSWGEPREGEQRSGREEEGEDELKQRVDERKDECADQLWVLCLRGAGYHCEEWEHMGIAVCCQQAYWHHTETQAVIKSHLIYSHSVLLSFSACQCLFSSLSQTHTYTQYSMWNRIYTDILCSAIYEVKSMIQLAKRHLLFMIWYP